MTGVQTCALPISLGNFAFQADHFSEYEGTDWSIVVSANISTGEINILPVKVQPDGQIGFGDGDELTNAYTKRCEMLSSPEYQKHYNCIAQELYPKWYARVQANSAYDAALLLHYFRCDAHRHILQQALSDKIHEQTANCGQFDSNVVNNSSVYATVNDKNSRLPCTNDQSQRSSYADKRIALRHHMAAIRPLNVIVGSGNSAFDGWVSTDVNEFDITQPKHWESLFEQNSIDRLLAEHVFEHIDAQKLTTVLRNARQYLRPGGRFRIAVPDANHPSAYVRELTKPGGLEPGADDHRVFLNIEDMIKLSVVSGFRLMPVEWFDAVGCFHRRNWDDSYGVVSRSSRYNKGRFDDPSEYKKLIESTPDDLRWQYEKFGITYTSLFVDFIKDEQYDISPDVRGLKNVVAKYQQNTKRFRSKYCASGNLSLFLEIASSLGLMYTDDMASERHFLNRLIPYIEEPVILDVGAHQGKYSSCIKDINSTAVIHAFEPNPVTFKKLQKVSEAIGLYAVNAGCSDHEGEAELFDYPTDKGSGHASFHKAVFEEFHNRDVQPVKTRLVTIDNYIRAQNIDRVSLLKIDTEGHEYHVLKGASKSIAEGIIGCIQFEFNAIHVQTKTFLRDIVKILYNFSFYRLVADGLLPLGNYNALTWELFQLQNIVAIQSDHPLRKILEI